MRTVLIIFGVLVGLLIAGAVGFALALDPIVLRVARTQTTNALGVPVRIDDADASLGGRLELEGFDAGNPEGFAEPRSIRFHRVAGQARLGSLFGDVVEVGELVVERPELTLEFKGTKSNFAGLMEHLASQKPREEAERGEAKKFRIRRLRVEGATVRFRSDALSGGTREVTLPNVELANLGSAEGAATTSDILAAVLQTLAAEAMKAGRNLLPADLLRSLGGDIDAAARRFGGLVNDAAERVRQIPGLLEEKVKERVEDEVEKGLDRLRRRD